MTTITTGPADDGDVTGSQEDPGLPESVQTEATTAPPHANCAVVAIGASAGGLDALEKVFDGLAPDVGATYIVIQHLSPDHKSMMANLLARHTSMPVVMVTDGMQAEPDHVYLIPPATMMAIDADKRLHLTPKNPRTLSLPIDFFFASLASQIGARSMGIVLSGTGSDGSRGVAAIHGIGGLIIVQDPETAKFDGMPRSAIATGHVDAILPPETIGTQIREYVRDARLLPGAVPAVDPLVIELTDPDEAFNGILALLGESGGIDFRDYKLTTVTRRIERRMAMREVMSLQAYYEMLQREPAEKQALRREMLVTVTSFFRDHAAFDELAEHVIAPLASTRQRDDTIRVWCVGVGTGEEAYSIAMLFAEAFEREKRWPTLKIFATDVDPRNIEIASTGVFPESVASEITSERLERFFNRRGNHYVVRSEIRQCIVFARQNLLTDPPFTRMDLTTCRNTLIYFRPDAQRNALRRLQFSLVPGGHLFLGTSESLTDLQRDFVAVSNKNKIFRMTRPAGLPLSSSRPALHEATAANRGSSFSTGTRTRSSAVPAVDSAAMALLQAYSPPSVLVNHRHELVHSFGDVTRFLTLQPGNASLEVQRLLPVELAPVAAGLLFRLSRQDEPIASDPIPFGIGDERALVRLVARRVAQPGGEALTLLSFQSVESGSPAPTMASVALDSVTADRIDTLERALAVTRESLQTTIEELETTNEELQASNEELMASNEELQSSNEELQSVNEELNTVNAENQEKIELLNQLNADLESMGRSFYEAMIFVDEDLRLKRFNPPAMRIFKLREGDIGRPLDDFAHTLDYPSLAQDLRATVASGKMIECEVKSTAGADFLVRMMPYNVPSSQRKGAVATFVEITSVRAANRLQHILDGLVEHIAVLDNNGTITLVNAAWQRFAACNGDPFLARSGVGSNYLAACHPSHEIDGNYATLAADGVRSVLQGRQDRFTLEYPCHSPTEQRWFVMNVIAAPWDGGSAVVSHFDITRWHR